VAIISDILNLEQIGVYDNFFELGGNSLLATQVMSRLRQACSVELSLRTLFESSTIAQLAEQIDQIQEQATVTAPAIPKLSRESRSVKRASLK
jgi:acyl carrier protein